MSFAEILETAAFEVLLPPGVPDDLPRKNGDFYQRCSCNAIEFTYGNARATEETSACRDWFFNTVLCADRGYFPAAVMEGYIFNYAGTTSIGFTHQPPETSQNIRFMLLLFASYLAEDLGL